MKRLELKSFLGVFLYFGVLFGLNALFNLFVSRDSLFFLAWIIAALVAVISNRPEFKCPRCNKPFYRRAAFYNGFTRKCLNCGLKKYDVPTSRTDSP